MGMSNIFYKQPRIALKFSFLLHTHLVKKNLEKSRERALFTTKAQVDKPRYTSKPCEETRRLRKKVLQTAPTNKKCKGLAEFILRLG